MISLWRFAWRELRRAKARTALIALVLTIQAAALAGSYLSQDSLYFTRDFWSERLKLADLDLHFVPASAAEMPSLDTIRKIPGVAAADRRFLGFGYIEKADAAPLPVVIHYLDPAQHPAVDDVELLSGRWLERGKPNLALVDRSFATAQAIAIGDDIVVNPHRFASRFTIGGTALSAEHLVPTANPEHLVPHKGSLGIVYASRESLDKTFSEELYNDIVVTFEKGANAQKTTDAILAALSKSGLEIERVDAKQATFGYRFIDVMLSGSRSVTPVIAFIIALMAAIVAFISMSRIVAERRREIGCLLAQGFSEAQLALCFFALGLVPGVVGGLLGIPAAMFFAKKVALTTAAISGFPAPIMLWQVKWFALGAGSSVLVGLLSALPPAFGILRQTPAQALRATSEIAFCGLPAGLERLLSGKPSIRYAVRNVFRRARLSVATATLVALAVALPSGLLTSISSWDSWAQEQARVAGWDVIASFKVPLPEEHVGELMSNKGIAAWDGYVQGYLPVRRQDGTVEEMRVRGEPIESELIPCHVTAGRHFSSNDADEAVLNTSFSGDHPPRLGETVSVLRHGESHRLTVVGFVTDATLSTIMIPRTTAQRLLGVDGKLSGVYARLGAPPAVVPTPEPPSTRAARSTANAEAVETIDLGDAAPAAIATKTIPFPGTKTALLDDELVTSVQIRSEFAGATLDYLAAFIVVIVPFVGLGATLAFFFLLSVLAFLLLERETEYATLRSMGYATGEIARIVLTEVGALAIVGVALSVGTWAVTAYALRAPTAHAWFAVPLDFRLHDFCFCSLPTCIFLGVAALPGIRALMRTNLSTALRGRALG